MQLEPRLRAIVAQEYPRFGGVQVGELIRVTKTGFERLHNAPRGFWRAPLGGAASSRRGEWPG